MKAVFKVVLALCAALAVIAWLGRQPGPGAGPR